MFTNQNRGVNVKKIRLTAKQRERSIIRSAIDVFSKSNYRHATIAGISNRAGITEPVIYKHFDSKKDVFLKILTAITEKVFNDFSQQDFLVEEKIETKDHLNFAIQQSVIAYFNTLKRHRKELKIFYQAISEVDDEEIRNVLMESYEQFAEMYAQLFQVGVRRGILPVDYNVSATSWDVIGYIIHQSTLFILGFYDEKNAKIFLEKRVDSWLD